MYGGTMRVIEMAGSPAALGEAHGSTLGQPIRAYLADRLELSGDPFWSGRVAEASTVLSLAEKTLDHHEAFDADLYLEMTAMADAAGITTAEAVVVGGFTDLIDLVRAAGGPAIEEDDCTSVIDADRGILAQTWDMHASAGEHVVLLKIEPDSGPRALVQTTAGCLGQIGMNEAGVAVGINNLTSIGGPGVTWPFVVRRVLKQTSLDDAVKVVLDAELAGGHNYLLMGPDGAGCNIEAMPGARHVTPVDTGVFVHSNHCLDPRTALEEGATSPLSAESSAQRLRSGSKAGGDLAAFFSDPTINRRGGSPSDVATCGAVSMSPARRSLEAVWGLPGEYPWEQFDFG
jgi:isopenicillin-N N-acyltransferase-like protein